MSRGERFARACGQVASALLVLAIVGLLARTVVWLWQPIFELVGDVL